MERKATFQLKVRERKMQSSFLSKHERTVCCTTQIQSLNLWGLLCVLSPVRYLLVRWQKEKQGIHLSYDLDPRHLYPSWHIHSI